MTALLSARMILHAMISVSKAGLVLVKSPLLPVVPVLPLVLMLPVLPLALMLPVLLPLDQMLPVLLLVPMPPLHLVLMLLLNLLDRLVRLLVLLLLPPPTALLLVAVQALEPVALMLPADPMLPLPQAVMPLRKVLLVAFKHLHSVFRPLLLLLPSPSKFFKYSTYMHKQTITM